MGTHHTKNWPRAAATMAPDLQKEFAAHAGEGRVGNHLLTQIRTAGQSGCWPAPLPTPGCSVPDQVRQHRPLAKRGFVSDTAFKPGDIGDGLRLEQRTRRRAFAARPAAQGDSEMALQTLGIA